MGLRVGQGIDFHRFGSKRPLRLGGVTIPHDQGLEGHSDADVLLHALTDAILGALGKPDIGQHFPPSDPQYKGADSMKLLEIIVERYLGSEANVLNVDLTILCEKPKISPFREAIQTSIASALGIPQDCVGCKATTTEEMGALGRGEGISCSAVVLLEKRG